MSETATIFYSAILSMCLYESHGDGGGVIIRIGKAFPFIPMPGMNLFIEKEGVNICQNDAVRSVNYIETDGKVHLLIDLVSPIFKDDGLEEYLEVKLNAGWKVFRDTRSVSKSPTLIIPGGKKKK